MWVQSFNTVQQLSSIEKINLRRKNLGRVTNPGFLGEKQELYLRAMHRLCCVGSKISLDSSGTRPSPNFSQVEPRKALLVRWLDADAEDEFSHHRLGQVHRAVEHRHRQAQEKVKIKRVLPFPTVANF